MTGRWHSAQDYEEESEQVLQDVFASAQEFFAGQTDWITVPTVRPDSGDVRHHPFDGEINHFVDCVINNKDSFVDLADAARTHEICYALERSSTEGRPVKIKEVS